MFLKPLTIDLVLWLRMKNICTLITHRGFYESIAAKLGEDKNTWSLEDFQHVIFFDTGTRNQFDVFSLF